MGLFVAATGRAQPPPTTAPADALPPVPTTKPAHGVLNYQPGVTIDWPERRIEVAATVILRDAPIELFACSPRAREHESIVRIEARPLHVFEALGLIGLTNGHPVEWDEQRQTVIPPTGDPVSVRVRYQQNGEMHTVSAWDWLKRSDGQPFDERPPWVFAGSVRDSRGRFAADLEGTVVAIVDFPTALLALQATHTSDNDALWLECNTDAIPPVGTSCTLILEPPGPTATVVTVHMDRFAGLTCDGKPVTTEALEARVRAALKVNPSVTFELVASALAAKADVRRMAEQLKSWGVPAERLTVREDQSSSMLPNDPAALLALLHRGIPIAPAIGDSIAEQRRSLLERVHQTAEAARALADGGGAAIDETIRQVRAVVDKRKPSGESGNVPPDQEPK